jgi:hypothetical protein
LSAFRLQVGPKAVLGMDNTFFEVIRLDRQDFIRTAGTLGEVFSQVGFISSRESAVFWKKPLSLELQEDVIFTLVRRI